MASSKGPTRVEVWCPNEEIVFVFTIFERKVSDAMRFKPKRFNGKWLVVVILRPEKNQTTYVFQQGDKVVFQFNGCQKSPDKRTNEDGPEVSYRVHGTIDEGAAPHRARSPEVERRSDRGDRGESSRTLTHGSDAHRRRDSSPPRRRVDGHRRDSSPPRRVDGHRHDEGGYHDRRPPRRDDGGYDDRRRDVAPVHGRRDGLPFHDVCPEHMRSAHRPPPPRYR